MDPVRVAGIDLVQAPEVDEEKTADPLVAYANGSMSRTDSIQALGLRDYAGLLVALGDRGLAPPRRAPQEIESQAALFERIWKDAGETPGDEDLPSTTP